MYSTDKEIRQLMVLIDQINEMEAQIGGLLSHIDDLANTARELEAQNFNLVLELGTYQEQYTGAVIDIQALHRSLNEMTAARNHYRDLFSMLGEEMREHNRRERESEGFFAILTKLRGHFL